MKYYVYLDDTGEGNFADTEEEAIKIAQDLVAADYDDCEVKVLIYKLDRTMFAKTTITFNVVREDTYNGS